LWGPSRHLGSSTAANWVSFDLIVSCSSCWGYSLINTLKLKKSSNTSTGILATTETMTKPANTVLKRLYQTPPRTPCSSVASAAATPERHGVRDCARNLNQEELCTGLSQHLQMLEVGATSCDARCRTGDGGLSSPGVIGRCHMPCCRPHVAGANPILLGRGVHVLDSGLSAACGRHVKVGAGRRTSVSSSRGTVWHDASPTYTEIPSRLCIYSSE